MASPATAPQGRFITLDGIDGCGKSTQAALLAGRLRAAGLDVVETREPGGTAIGAQLRRVLLDSRNGGLVSEAELLLYLADRVQHLAEVIRPALARGQMVVCDRYHDATVAYQHHGRGVPIAALAPFIAAHVGATPPHLTLWLDVPLQAAAQRRNTRPDSAAGGGADERRLDDESAAFFERVRAGYEALWRAEPERIVRIDAGGSVEDVAAAVWAAVRERLERDG